MQDNKGVGEPSRFPAVVRRLLHRWAKKSTRCRQRLQRCRRSRTEEANPDAVDDGSTLAPTPPPHHGGEPGRHHQRRLRSYTITTLPHPRGEVGRLSVHNKQRLIDERPCHLPVTATRGYSAPRPSRSTARCYAHMRAYMQTNKQEGTNYHLGQAAYIHVYTCTCMRLNYLY